MARLEVNTASPAAYKHLFEAAPIVAERPVGVRPITDLQQVRFPAVALSQPIRQTLKEHAPVEITLMSRIDSERLARVVQARRETAKVLPALLTHAHTLSSGLIVRQNFHECSRPVLFATGLEGFEYATGGGTLIVVLFRGHYYAITCAHVFKEFEWANLIIPNSHLGVKEVRPIRACFPTTPIGEAIGSDIVDACILRLPFDLNSDFFGQGAYIIDPNTVCSSETGDSIIVSGVLKNPSNVAPPNIHSAYAILELTDIGPRSDPFLRDAAAAIDPPPEFDRLTGLSGAPVYNMKRRALCGMVMRGGITGTKLSVVYMEMADIVKLVEAVSEERPDVSYTKLRPVQSQRTPRLRTTRRVQSAGRFRRAIRRDSTQLSLWERPLTDNLMARHNGRILAVCRLSVSGRGNTEADIGLRTASAKSALPRLRRHLVQFL